MKINGQVITAEIFAWDGCHKIYLVNSEADLADVEGYQLHAIAELPRIWERSCGLRFINTADLSAGIVGQGEDASFTDTGEGG